MVPGLFENTKVWDIFSQLSQFVIVIFLPGYPVLAPALHDGKRGCPHYLVKAATRLVRQTEGINIYPLRPAPSQMGFH